MARTNDHTGERAAIRAAMHRLLSGQPINSTGALTVLQLATEAGVKRWVLTHKHPDLRTEFEEQRDKVNGIPQAYQYLQARVVDLEVDNKRLRTEKAELSKRVDTYAQVIHELTTELERLRIGTSDNVRVLATSTRPGQVRGRP
jgi:septal ring factor EnvC (AmiA/AmiB activator)